MNILVKKLCLPVLLLIFTMPVLAAGGEVEPIKWMKLVYKVINSIIFFGGLGWLLRKSVGEFFSNRERNIRDSLELAEKSVKDAKEKLDEIERNMANLDSQLFGFRLVQQLFELRQRFAARFVQMDVLPGPDAAQGGRNANALFGFHRHGLKTGNGQQLVCGHHS